MPEQQPPISEVFSDTQQPILVEPPVDDWRYSPEPPRFDGEGQRVTEIAEDWRRDSATLPWQVVRCCQCQDLMATRDPKKHDCCESCGYRIRQDFFERRQADIRRATDRLVNPFASGDVMHELSGSLPPIVSSPTRRQ